MSPRTQSKIDLKNEIWFKAACGGNVGYNTPSPNARNRVGKSLSQPAFGKSQKSAWPTLSAKTDSLWQQEQPKSPPSVRTYRAVNVHSLSREQGSADADLDRLRRQEWEDAEKARLAEAKARRARLVANTEQGSYRRQAARSRGAAAGARDHNPNDLSDYKMRPDSGRLALMVAGCSPNSVQASSKIVEQASRWFVDDGSRDNAPMSYAGKGSPKKKTGPMGFVH